jgi:hypothetical protein
VKCIVQCACALLRALWSGVLAEHHGSHSLVYSGFSCDHFGEGAVLLLVECTLLKARSLAQRYGITG